MASRLYGAVVYLRDVLDESREPVDSDLLEMIHGTIMSQTKYPVPSLSYPEVIRATYRLRRNELQRAIEPPIQQRVEIEALLGGELARKVASLSQVAAELMGAVALCAFNKNGTTDPVEEMDHDDKNRKMLVKNAEDGQDDFGKKLELLISEILIGADQYR